MTTEKQPPPVLNQSIQRPTDQLPMNPGIAGAPEGASGVYLRDLCELIDGDRFLHAQVMELAVRAAGATWLTEAERAAELGNEIRELFTKPVSYIGTYATPMHGASRLLYGYFERVDLDALGRNYLTAAARTETNQ